jgi:hypothetical protein
MENLKKNILQKLEKILDEELGNGQFLKKDSSKSPRPSPNDSISILSTQSSLIDDESQREVTKASTPIKQAVPIDLTLTPVKQAGCVFKIFLKLTFILAKSNLLNCFPVVKGIMITPKKVKTN